MDRATLRIASGHRAGFTIELATDPVIAGRHPDVDVRFDVDRDLTVSARHCEFYPTGDRWAVRDLGSRNGTYVNQRMAGGSVALAAGDVIMLGIDGPQIIFDVHAFEPTASAPQFREDTGARVRKAVHRATRRVRIAAGLFVAFLILLAGALYAVDRRERAVWESERAALQLRVDSLIQNSRTAEASLQDDVSGLTAALRASENRLRQLQAEIGVNRGNEPRVEELEQQLLSASAALRRQQLAASLDYSLIQRRNRSAVAMIWVEYTDGTRVTGTAFAVRPDGLLLTNRHLVNGTDGRHRVRRMVVRFTDSDQAFPGTVAAVAPDWDLAALRVSNVLGDVPTIGAFNLRSDTIRSGTPVALIGFPFGGEPDMDSGAPRRVARPLVSAGLVVTNDARAMEVQGLGAAGGSGSPIIDARGDVLAILYGGRSADGVPYLLGVPAAAAASFLAGVR